MATGQTIPIPGRLSLKVGISFTEEQQYIGSKPHPNPLVDGSISLWKTIQNKYWIVQFYDDEPLISEPSKEDAVKALRELVIQAQNALSALEHFQEE